MNLIAEIGNGNARLGLGTHLLPDIFEAVVYIFRKMPINRKAQGSKRSDKRHNMEYAQEIYNNMVTVPSSSRSHRTIAAAASMSK